MPLQKLQPIIKSGLSERTLKVDVEIPERKERFRDVTTVGTKEVLDYLAATGIPHGKLISSPGGTVNNRQSGVTASWVFEKIDLRVKEEKPTTSAKPKQSKKTKSS